MKSFYSYSHSHSRFNLALIAAVICGALLGFCLLSGIPRASAHGNANDYRSATNQLQSPTLIVGGIYRQTNLVSDIPGIAPVEDRQLINPWGIALSPTSPFWVVNNKTDRATIYQGDVLGSPLARNATPSSVFILNVPTIVATPTLPTAVVANTTTDFLVTPSNLAVTVPAQFIFVTRHGGINAWHPVLGESAIVVKFMSGNSYTGLAIGNNASGNFLYAADFANGKIDVFDKDFNPTTVPGNFADPTVPANFYPFNIQNLGGSLYVTYTETLSLPNSGFDMGYVRKFDTNGVRDAAFAINTGPLSAPWGLALAPASFGAFSNRLLVGNFRSLGIRDPSINAFDAATGAFQGVMVDESGAALEISKLRALVFGNGVNGGDPNTLYFSAGIYSEQHGLFGSLKPASLPTSQIKFRDAQYHTTENAGHFDVTVSRTGDTSGSATVNYATVDSGATQKSNYEIALGTLTFAPGETSKTFRVLIVDDNFIGGGSSRELDLVLSNATGAALVSPTTVKLFISDNEGDTQPQPENIIDVTQFFVRQQYFDFLNREPDAAGFDFWTNQITSCGADQQCVERKRINVSAAFFLSIEFQRTGMLAYLTEKAAFGGLPRYGSFMRDVQALQKGYVFGAPGAEAQLEANRQAFFDEFVTRPEFAARYGTLSNQNYVDTLLATGGLATTTGRLFLTRLTGSQLVPPVTTSATGLGVARITFDPNVVEFSLWPRNLSSAQTSAHLHGPAQPGANAPALFTLPNGTFTDFSITLAPQQSGDLRGGRLYFDVHTSGQADGEIRGQIPSQRFLRDVLIAGLDDGIITRAEALRLIAEDPDFRQNEFNRAFVLMEYFGYLRRNPDDAPDNSLSGYNFWLNKLNSFNGDYIKSEMVNAFISSKEYRQRFGP